MQINWIRHDRYEEAIAAADAAGKPILIYFHSKSCAGCVRLESEVFADPRVGRAISESAIPVWVEVETGKADAQVSALVGSHIFIMSPVVQLISSTGDIFHKVLGTPLHTRLDLGYCRVHHDVSGDIDADQFLDQIALGVGKTHLGKGEFDAAAMRLRAVAADAERAPLAGAEARYWLPVAQGSGRYPEEAAPSANIPAMSEIANEVRRFCSLICMIPDSELMADWPGTPGNGGWSHYTDCLREVCLGVYQTLLDTGHGATTMRGRVPRLPSAAQLILRDWQISYRTLQGTIHGLSCSDMDEQHLHQNYSLGKQRTIRNNIVHCIMAEFWAHASAIRAARNAFAGLPAADGKPVDPTWRQYGPPPPNFGPMASLLQTWETRHNELIQEFSQVGDAELDYEHSWWEGSGVSIRFRLCRMGWHLQDHAAVVETICERTGRVRSETERLSARIFTALGAAEGAMVGLPDEEKRRLFADAAASLHAKSNEIETLYARYCAAPAVGKPQAALQAAAAQCVA